MAQNVSQLVANWRMIIRTVTASMRANVDIVAAAIERELFPDDPRERVKTIILARADALDRKLATLEQRDRALTLERGDDAAVREEHGAAVLDLRQGVIRVRGAVEGAYAPSVLASVGLTGDTPVNPDALVIYATTAAEALRKPLPEPEDDLTPVDPARLASLLEERVARVLAAQDRTALEVREEQGALTARNTAEEDLRRSYIAGADGFAADAAAAGRPDIADRVRPTSRRRSGLPEPVDTETPTGTDPTLVDDPNPQR